MDLDNELLKEFDRVVRQCDPAANMASNLNISDIANGSEEPGSMILNITGELGEAGPEVKGEQLDLMQVAPAKQDDVNPSSLPSVVNWKLDRSIPHFLSKVYEIVDDPTTDLVVHWGFGGESFVVQDKATFCNVILPRYFKHSNFSSFIRQLNTYGFRKIDCDKWEYALREFQRGKIHQLKYIKRKASESKMKGVRPGKHDDTLQKYLEGTSAQISNLCQQVEVFRSIISAFEKRVQVVELKYKQLACVLLKTIQNPSFIAELLERRAFIESKHDGGFEFEKLSDQKLAAIETDGAHKLSSESTHLLLTCNATALSPNQAQMQLSVHMSAPSCAESSSSRNEPQGSSVEMIDSVEALIELHELMNEVEPCEGITAEKCMHFLHELQSFIRMDEYNDDLVVYEANQPAPVDKKQ